MFCLKRNLHVQHVPKRLIKFSVIACRLRLLVRGVEDTKRFRHISGGRQLFVKHVLLCNYLPDSGAV